MTEQQSPGASRRETRVYVDIGPTLTHGGRTGIQRVCRELMRHLDGRTVQGLHFVFGEFDAQGQWRTATERSAPTEISIGRVGRYHAFAARLRERCPAWLRPLLRLPNRLMLRYVQSTVYAPTPAATALRVPADADWLASIDAGWLEPHERRRRVGAPEILLVYDLIPVQFPEFCLAAHASNFNHWLQTKLQDVRGMVTISAAARADIEDWLRTQGRSMPVRHFHLGADYSMASQQPPSAAFPEGTLANRPYFLVVGTLELRKDHLTVLAAYKQYRQHGGQAELVLVGGPGFGSDRILAAVEQLGQQGYAVHWFDRASDEVLKALYERAAAVICASRAEGFGLPVVEGALYGRVVLAARTPVFMELAEGFAHFFTPGDPQSLAQCLQATDAGELLPADAARAAGSLLTWRQASDQFVDAIGQIIHSAS